MKVYGIIFDKNANSHHLKLDGKRVFANRSDAERYLNALIQDYGEIYNWDDYEVMELDVME